MFVAAVGADDEWEVVVTGSAADVVAAEGEQVAVAIQNFLNHGLLTEL